MKLLQIVTCCIALSLFFTARAQPDAERVIRVSTYEWIEVSNFGAGSVKVELIITADGIGLIGSTVPKALIEHLEDLSNYSWMDGWVSVQSETGSVSNIRITSAKVDPREPVVLIVLAVESFGTGYGRLNITPPEGWVLTDRAVGGTKHGGILVTNLNEEEPQRFRSDYSLGGSLGEGFSLEVTADSSVSRFYSDNRSGAQTSLSFGAKVPLYKVTLPNGSDAQRSTSDEFDTVRLSLDHSNYSRGGTLFLAGLRSLSTSRLQSGEIVAYTGLMKHNFTSPSQTPVLSSYTFASDVELGYRWGDVEWTNLKTTPEAPGDFVGRVAFMVELWPTLGIFNRNIGQGLNFYVRGRYWLDTADGVSDRIVRGRGFIDAEIFLPLQEGKLRAFLRYENGMLPPNLGTATSRVYIGIGGWF